MMNFDECDPAKTKVVIGLSGGMDSAVAAFILKKRGFQCIAVSLQVIKPDMIADEIKNYIDQKAQADFENFNTKSKNKINLEHEVKFLNDNCSIGEIEKVKNIADFLDIPFYAVNAQLEFNDYVLDPLIASKLSGQRFFPCISCHQFKIKILQQKAQFLGASFFATGHYAKIKKIKQENKENFQYQLLTASDENYDQSYLLSQLTQHELMNFVLPLSELKHSDVSKIVQQFKIPSFTKRDNKKWCLINQGQLNTYIEMKTPESLRPKGIIVEKTNNTTLGEHEGIYQYNIGQKNIEGKLTKFVSNNIDKDKVVIGFHPSGKIYVGREDYLKFSACVVGELSVDEQFDQTKPFEVCVQYDLNKEKVFATLYFKNNANAILEFKETVYNLARGQFISLYNRSGHGARLIGSGTIVYLGELTAVNRLFEIEKTNQKQNLADLDLDEDENDNKAEKETAKGKGNGEFLF